MCVNFQLLRLKNKNKVFGICYIVRQLSDLTRAYPESANRRLGERSDSKIEIPRSPVCNRSYEVNLISPFSNCQITELSHCRIIAFHSFILPSPFRLIAPSRPFESRPSSPLSNLGYTNANPIRNSPRTRKTAVRSPAPRLPKSIAKSLMSMAPMIMERLLYSEQKRKSSKRAVKMNLIVLNW